MSIYVYIDICLSADKKQPCKYLFTDTALLFLRGGVKGIGGGGGGEGGAEDVDISIYKCSLEKPKVTRNGFQPTAVGAATKGPPNVCASRGVCGP